MKYLERVWAPSVVLREPRFLSADECEAIRLDMLTSPSYVGTIVKRGGSPTIDTRIRRATNVEVSDQSRALIDDRLHCAKDILAGYFQTRASGHQRSQYLIYREGDFFRRHRDQASEYGSNELASRRVSLVIFLNDARTSGGHDFEGGLLSFIGRFDDGGVERTRLDVTPEEGMLVAFPPDLLHEVLRVKRGLRFTSVSWLA